MQQYLIDHKNEIVFPVGHTGDITQNIIAGLLHKRGTFRNIGFDPRYEIIWKNKETQTALTELAEFKNNFLSLIENGELTKDISITLEDVIMEPPIKGTTLDLKNLVGLKSLIFLKREMNIYKTH